MAKVFVYSDIPELASELVSGMHEAGHEVSLVCFGESQPSAGAEIDYVIAADRPESCSETVATLLAEKGADLFLVGSSFRGRELAASVAARLDAPMVSDALTLEVRNDGSEATRSIMGGNVIESVDFSGFGIVTMGKGRFEVGAAAPTESIETIAAMPDERIRRLGIDPREMSDVDLGSASTVVGVGLGLDSEEDLSLVQELARILGAAVGCTRDVAEQRRWLPKEAYIGITGAVVSPQLYIAVGVSGQMQHVFGVRDARTIVAVNTDANAPIFKAADYGIVGDLKDVVPALVAAIESGR